MNEMLPPKETNTECLYKNIFYKKKSKPKNFIKNACMYL